MDIRKPLQRVLQTLEAERMRIERQIDAVRLLIGDTNSRGGDKQAGRGRGRARGRRRRMSAAQRRAASKRMKEFWARRRANGARKKAAAA